MFATRCHAGDPLPRERPFGTPATRAHRGLKPVRPLELASNSFEPAAEFPISRLQHTGRFNRGVAIAGAVFASIRNGGNVVRDVVVERSDALRILAEYENESSPGTETKFSSP